MKIARRTLALLICALMVLSAMPAFAATYETFEEKTFTFDQDYVVTGNLQIGNSSHGSATVEADPQDSTNYALKITQSGTSAISVGPYYGGSAISGPLSLEFDFYTTNTACAFSINPRNSKNSGNYSVSLVGSVVKEKHNGSQQGTATYKANTWYHITYVVDFANAYVALTLQEKGTRTVQGVQIRNHASLASFSDGKFTGYTLGHQTTIAGDFYIDNLTQKTISSFSVPTDEGTMYNNLSDTVWKFDGNNLANYISTSVNGNEDIGNANTNTVALENVDGKTALALHQTYDTTGIQAITYQNYSSRFNTLHTKFTIKKTGGDAGRFGINLRGLDASGSDKTGSLLKMTEGKLHLLWTEIGTYELDTWYDFDIKIDLTQKYAHFEMKKSNETQWKCYDVSFDKMYSPSSTNAQPVSNVDRLYIQWYGGTANGGDVYITNYMQNTISGLVPTMNAHNDSFDALNIVETSATAANYTNGWYAQNFTDGVVAADIKAVNGENMLEITSSSASNATISKAPVYSASNALHRIRIKMSGADDGSDRNILYATLNEYDTEYSKDKDVNVADIRANYFKLGDTTYQVALDRDKMYDVELVYDASNKNMVVSLTADDGTQYVGSVANATTADTWGPLAKIMITNATDANGGSIRLDEFKWDILPTTAADGVVTNENGTNNAALDEWVTVQLAETIDATCLDDVSVTLTKDGNACTTPYTLVADGEALIVKFTQLDKASTYEINVSGVKTLLGRTPEVGSLTFTTADASFAVAKPVLSDSKISATVDSNYSHGKDGILVVAFYKGGCLTNITSTPLNTSKGITTTDIDISSYAGTDETIKAFVFDSLDGLYPYAENFAQ